MSIASDCHIIERGVKSTIGTNCSVIEILDSSSDEDDADFYESPFRPRPKKPSANPLMNDEITEYPSSEEDDVHLLDCRYGHETAKIKDGPVDTRKTSNSEKKVNSKSAFFQNQNPSTTTKSKTIATKATKTSTKNKALDVLFAADEECKERERHRSHRACFHYSEASANPPSNHSMLRNPTQIRQSRRRNDIVGGSGVGDGHFTFTAQNDEDRTNNHDNYEVNDSMTRSYRRHNSSFAVAASASNDMEPTNAEIVDKTTNRRRKAKSTSSYQSNKWKRKGRRGKKAAGKYSQRKRSNKSFSQKNKQSSWVSRENNVHPYCLIDSQDPQLKNIGGATITFD